jgi:cardiolipin synthase
VGIWCPLPDLDFVDYLTILGAALILWLILVVLFAPNIAYRIEDAIDLTGDHFVHMLESTCQGNFKHGNKIEILTNGPAFYPAMLDAIRTARETVNMEVYMFKPGETADRFVEALAERARAGVRVTLVMDAIGSLGHYRHIARRLRPSGCRVEPYQRMMWYRLARLNNRTHRELLVVDGEVASVGGAGVADWWSKPLNGKPIWRDKRLAPAGSSGAFAIKSSPSDRATISRVLFQTLIEGSARAVRITTPYFLPDRTLRRALTRVVKRGVEITVIVPGHHTDQRVVRLASRRSYGSLLKAGVRIFEYEPGMMHAKVMVVDDLWSVIGSTNIDNRSFEHNDEVNIAIRDEAVAARLNRDFDADVKDCDRISFEDWRRRPLWEKLVGTFVWLLERQQ